MQGREGVTRPRGRCCPSEQEHVAYSDGAEQRTKGPKGILQAETQGDAKDCCPYPNSNQEPDKGIIGGEDLMFCKVISLW